MTAQGDGRVVAGKSSGVKGDDGCWIMDVSRLLLDPHSHTQGNFFSAEVDLKTRDLKVDLKTREEIRWRGQDRHRRKKPANC